MYQHKVLLAVVFLFSASCSADFAHDNPYDPETPLSRQAKASLSGTVALEQQGDPRQATVTVAYPGGQVQIQPEEDGSFLLAGIPPGARTLRIDAPYYQVEQRDVVLSLGEERLLEPVQLPIKRAAVSGSVAIQGEALSFSVEGALVSLRQTKRLSKSLQRLADGEADGGNSYATTALADGSYTFDGVPAGVYEVSVSKSGAGSEPTEISVDGEGAVTVANLFLLPLTGSFSIAGGAYSASRLLTLELLGMNAATMQIGEENGGQCAYSAPAITYNISSVYQLDDFEGEHVVCVRYGDSEGRSTADYRRSVVLDRVAPTLTDAAFEAGLYTKSPATVLALSAVGADQMRITDATNPNASWESFAVRRAYTLLDGEGVNNVFVSFRDWAGNEVGPLQRSIILDQTRPQLGANALLINFGQAVTSNPVVTLAFNVAGASEVKVSEDAALADAVWQPYSAQRTFLLSASNEKKTVYALFRDPAGNETTLLAQAEIDLDTRPITSPYLNIQASITSATIVSVDLSAGSIALDASPQMMLSQLADFSDTSWIAYTPFTTFTFTGSDGLKTLYAKFKKGSGAESAIAFDTYKLDRQAPEFTSVSANGNAFYLAANQATLNLVAIDAVAGVESMQFSETGSFDGIPRVPYALASIYPFLSTGDGLKTIWARFFDAAGNASAPVSVDVFIDTADPDVSLFQTEDQAGNPLTLYNRTRVTVHLEATDDTPLQMLVSNRTDFAGSAWQPYQAQLLWDVLPSTIADGEPRTIHAKVRDSAGRTVNLTGYDFTVDTVAPTGVAMDIAGDAITTPSVTINFAYNNADWIELAPDIGFQNKRRFSARASTTYTFTASEGIKTLFARFFDEAGNVSETVADQIELDAAPPQLASFRIQEGAATNAPIVHLELTAVDAVEMQIAENSCGGAWIPYSSAYAHAFTNSTEGTKTIAVRYRDTALNATACITQAVTYDVSAPEFGTPPLLLNNGAAATSDRAILAEFQVSGAISMRISESPVFTGALWSPYSASVGWTLVGGDGPKQLYAQFRDEAGNLTSAVVDDIIYDATPPTFNAASAPPFTNQTDVTITLTASGAAELRMSELPDLDAAPWVAFTEEVEFALNAIDGGHTVYVQVRDSAGNESLVRSVAITLDRTAPLTPVVSILGGAYTKTASLSVQIIADQVVDIMLSQQADLSDASWQPYSQLKAFALTGGEGGKTIYVRVRDAAGNTSPIGSATVQLDTTAPAVTLFEARDIAGNPIVASNQLRFYVALAVTDDSPLTVQYNTSNVFSLVAPEPVQPLRPWDAAAVANPLGEDRTVYARLLDQAGNETVVGPLSVLVDTAGPTGAQVSVASALVTSPAANVTLFANNADFVELSSDISFLNPAYFPYQAFTSFTLPPGDGAKTIYARFLDLHGNYSSIAGANLILDSTPPQAPSFTIEQGSLTNQMTVNLNFSAVGANELQVSENTCSGLWLPYGSSAAYAFTSATEGYKFVRVRYRDAAGNMTECLSRSILLDQTPPYFTAAEVVAINGAATSTTERAVTLSFAVTDATEMLVSESASFTGSVWLPFTPTLGWVLSEGEGSKTLFARFRDSARNATVDKSDTIFVAPSVPAVSILDGQYTRYTTVQVQVLTNNATEVQLSQEPDMAGAPWVQYSAVKPYVLTGADGLKTIYVRVRDGIGNISGITSASITLDRVAPNVTSFKAVDAFGTPITYSQQTRYYMQVTATDLTPLFVQFSAVASFIGSVPEELQAIRPWDAEPATDPDGAVRQTYARLSDSAGNFTVVGPIEVLVDNVGVEQQASSIAISPNPTSSPTVSVTLFSQTAASVELAEDPLFLVSTTFAFKPATDFTLTPGEGLRYLYARFFDSGGNPEGPVTATTYIDTTYPQNVGFTIDESPAAPALTVHVRSTTTGATEMRIGEGSCSGAWVPFSSVREFTFGNGINEIKTVAVQYRDAVNHQSACVTEDILLDTSLTSITSVSPAVGGAGLQVNIFGNNIGQQVGEVKFGGVLAQLASWSDTKIVAIVPATVPVGQQPVVVTIDGRSSPGFPFTVIPGITSVGPPLGIVGTWVTLTGGGYGPTQAGSTVSVGGIYATVTTWSTTSLSFQIPAGVGGKTQPIIVTVDGIASNPASFTVLPHIATLTPDTGPAETPVVLTGANFGFTQGSSRVIVGGALASITSWSNTSIAAVLPDRLPPGAVPVYVVVAGLSSPPAYFHNDSPWIDHRYPRLVTAGSTLWLVGSSFGEDSSTVTIGGVSASLTLWNNGVVSAVVPPGLPAGHTQVSLTAADGRLSNQINVMQRGNDQWIKDDAPEGRETAAVWTGYEMIFFGGAEDNYQVVNGGFRYNLATDTWMPLGLAGAPVARRDHAAVWTGTNMLIWGGIDSNGFDLGDGALYDPASDSWAPVSMTGAPTGRAFFTYVWTGTEFILWGGTASGTNPADGARYDPLEDTWTALPAAPPLFTGRELATAVWTGAEMIIWGGYASPLSLRDGARYNPGTNAWVYLPPSTTVQDRYWHSAVWTGSEMIIWGGYSESAPYDMFTGARYNPATDQWTQTNLIGAPIARYEHSAIWTGSKMIIWGGFNYDYWYETYNDGFAYDPLTDSWSPISQVNAPSKRQAHVALWTGFEMLIWGGYREDDDVNLFGGGRYSPETDTWVSISTGQSLPSRYQHVAAWTGSEMLVWGGGNEDGLAMHDGGRYDPVTHTWLPISTNGAPIGRYRPEAVWTGSRFIVWGGYNSGYLGDGGVYEPATDTWSPMALTDAPTGRQSHTMVWTGDVAIVFGGFGCPSSCDELNSGAIYYPLSNTWETLPTLNSPSSREDHTAVWTGTEMIVWGGNNGTTEYGAGSSDGGKRFNLATRTWNNMANPPLTSRTLHDAAWTGLGMAVWGGYNSGYYDSGAIYYPASNTWATITLLDAPAARRNATFLHIDGQLLVWGGIGNFLHSQVVGGIYDIQSNTWRTMSTIDSPMGRQDHTAVWTGNELLIYGGRGNSQYGGIDIYIP